VEVVLEATIEIPMRNQPHVEFDLETPAIVEEVQVAAKKPVKETVKEV